MRSQRVLRTTSLSVADSAPHTSPERPSSWRTAASRVGRRMVVKRSVRGSKRTIASSPESAGVVLAHPQPAARVRPDAPGALVGGRRLRHRGASAAGVDPRDVASGERRVPDLAARRGGDAVRPGPARGGERAYAPAARIDAAVDAGLAGEPQAAGAIEGRRVEVGARAIVGQRETAHAQRPGIDADDRVEPAVGDPRRTVGTDDDAVWRRALPERDEP